MPYWPVTTQNKYKYNLYHRLNVRSYSAALFSGRCIKQTDSTIHYTFHCRCMLPKNFTQVCWRFYRNITHFLNPLIEDMQCRVARSALGLDRNFRFRCFSWFRFRQNFTGTRKNDKFLVHAFSVQIAQKSNFLLCFWQRFCKNFGASRLKWARSILSILSNDCLTHITPMILICSQVHSNNFQY